MEDHMSVKEEKKSIAAVNAIHPYKEPVINAIPPVDVGV